jgi:penicillin-binding protein-related factor A (putative recombinase)
LYNVALVAFEKRETPDKTREFANYNIQKEQIALLYVIL